MVGSMGIYCLGANSQHPFTHPISNQSPQSPFGNTHLQFSACVFRMKGSLGLGR